MYFVTLSYYKKIKKDPTYSLNYDEKTGCIPATIAEIPEDVTITKRQLANFFTFIAGVIICVVCTIKLKWSQKEIASCFFGIMIVCGFISGMSLNEIAKAFIKGCKSMVYAAFIVGVAQAISLILSNGKVLDTIVYAISLPLTKCGSVLGAGLMMLANALINILIPSGSGQATVVMPLFVPVADLVGITRQVCVQAFSFGDGLSNLATPLNGPLVGCLAIAGVGFPKYFKWAIKYILIEIGAAFIITMVLSAMGWTGL